MILPGVLGPFTAIDEIIPLIIKAIEQKLVLEFKYRGLSRIVEPYELGVTVAGHHLLRAYQFDGESFRGKVEGWKLFRLDYMSDMVLTEKTFDPRDEYYVLPPRWTHEVLKCI